MVFDGAGLVGKVAVDCVDTGEDSGDGCCEDDDGIGGGGGGGGAGGEALKSRIAWAAERSSGGRHRTEGLSSSEYGRYISFFLGGSDRAAPVLVKHIANDLVRGSGRDSFGDCNVAYDGDVTVADSPGR